MSAGTPGRCTPKRKGVAVSLPVLAGGTRRASNAWQAGHDKIRRSRAGRWRALVLVLVHVAIAVHILLWLRTGLTVSPVEPSESMQTLREGVVNAGFVFFLLALLSTAILGRWFCGWGCHIVALQDLCSWLMMKLGVRPKPFRSRLLILVPLGLAIYMFVWPVVHREVVRPLLMDERGRLPWWLGQSDPIPGVTTEFLVHDFWATFAPWHVAIPFILVCTFGVVYFLGSKGFCTYGCPYGGFFAPLDKVAVGRIRVTDACEHCGHCTAVCTSNVRVHEEVRDFGMVVDPGCMKCMDCVSVCPNEALYFGVGRPSLAAKPRDESTKASLRQARELRAARYDLRPYEEIAVGLVFLAYFNAFRGMFNEVPMLMAVGIALVLAFTTWKLWTMRPVRLGGAPNVRVQSLQLRHRGKWRPWGLLLAVLTVAGMALAAWGGYIRVHRMLGDALYSQLTTPLGAALRPDYQPTERQASLARRGIAALDRSDASRLRWPLTPDEELNVAYMNVVLGRIGAARERMERVLERGHPRDSLISQMAAMIRTRLPFDRQPTEAEAAAVDQEIVALHERALAKHPELDGVRGFLVGRRLQREGVAAADRLREMWSEAAAARPARTSAFLGMARLEMALGGEGAWSRARELVGRAEVAMEHASIDDRLSVASMLIDLSRAAGPGDAERGKADLERGVELAREASRIGQRLGLSAVSAARVIAAAGRTEEALDLARLGVERARRIGPHTSQIRTFMGAADILLRAGRKADALELFRESGSLIVKAGDGSWDLHELGSQVLAFGTRAPDGAYLLEGVRLLEQARDAAAPGDLSAVILHDLAQAYFFADRQLDAERVMTDAAKLADRNAYLARALSELLATRGKAQEAVEWEAIAQRREREARRE